MRPPYRLLSLFLQYPDEEIVAGRSELSAAVLALPRSRGRRALERFAGWWCGEPADAIAREYVETFDLRKRSVLYLSWYLLGDTRRRGMELVRLKRLYRDAGLQLEPGELPDHLAVVLEFAELAPDLGARLLAEYRPSLEVIQAGLEKHASPWAHVLAALDSWLPALTRAQAERARRLIAEGPPDEQVGLEPFAPPEVVPAAEARR